MNILILLIIVLFIAFFVKVPAVKSVLFNHWLLSGYITILLICWGVVSIHSIGEVAGKEVKINELEKEDTALYKEAISGKLNVEMNKRAYKKWNFPRFQGNQLIINMETSVVRVVVERKKVNDRKIEVVYFNAMATVNGRKLVANPIGIHLVGKTLILQDPKRRSLHYSEFKSPFPVKQFTGESGIGGYQTFEGQNLLYLKIPHNVDIAKNSNLEIEYVQQ